MPAYSENAPEGSPDAPFDFTPARRDASVLGKLVALLEVTLVVGASIACALVAQQLIKPGLQETLALGSEAPPDFLAAAGVLAQQFTLQYGGMLALVLVFAILRKRRTARSYALATGPRPVWRLVVIGLVGGAFAALAAEAVFIAKELYPLGADTPLWGVIENADWDWRFWVFMAVGSFALVPILEEAAWRSYVLGRLVETFRPGAALIVTAVAFSLLHVQYLANGDALGYLTMASVVFSAVVYGAMTLKTGSLLPAVIAHVMINVPQPFEVGVVVFSAYLLISLIASRSILGWASEVLRDIWRPDTAIALALIVALIGLGVVASTFGVIGFAVFGGISLILVLAHAILTRSPWWMRPGR